MRWPYGALYRDQEPHRARRARGDDVEDQRRPTVLLSPTWPVGGRGREDDRQRILPASPAEAADGIRRGGREVARGEPRRQRRLICGTRNRQTMLQLTR